jgi:hypothetical protein
VQDIEPYYAWNDLYLSSEDENSPFFGIEYSEFEYSSTIYNYYIHPQWDDFGSTTLYIKILFADYDAGYVVLEFIGEWNDCINNDIMLLKRSVIEHLIGYGINKFILVGENVLNFHASDDCYYEEWFNEVEDGWIAAINFRDHVLTEFGKNNIDYYLIYGGELDQMFWRTYSPPQLLEKVESIINHRLS